MIARATGVLRALLAAETRLLAGGRDAAAAKARDAIRALRDAPEELRPRELGQLRDRLVAALVLAGLGAPAARSMVVHALAPADEEPVAEEAPAPRRRRSVQTSRKVLVDSTGRIRG